jgi:hypothetical protein
MTMTMLMTFVSRSMSESTPQRRGEIERGDEERIEPDADDVENDRAQHHVDDAKDFDEQIGRSEFAVRERFIPSLPRHGKSVQRAEQTSSTATTAMSTT